MLLRDLEAGKSDDIDAVLAALAEVNPDVVGLAGIDHDTQGHAVSALQGALKARGLDLPYHFAGPSNAGIRTPFDMNGDGRIGDPQDAQSFGAFSGAGGMALLSRFPVKVSRDFSALLWAGAPNSAPPLTRSGTPFPSADAFAIQRLVYKAHWQAKVAGISVILLAAAPPVFDGAEDRNGRRNADELALVRAQLDDAQNAPFVVMGTLNQDAAGDGEGRLDALLSVLSHPALRDPRQSAIEGNGRSEADAGRNTQHRGDPSMDTADFNDEGRNAPGNLRVDYVLPGRDLSVAGAGLHWPELGRRAVVWADVLPP